MRPNETLDHSPEQSPFRHSAAIYDSDDQFLAQVSPFIAEGAAAGDPFIVAVNPTQQDLLQPVLGAVDARVVFEAGRYVHPLDALQLNRSVFEGYLSSGAARVRLIGDLPRPNPSTWKGWARYEALCNHHLTDLPVSALCTYDTRETNDEVLADVRRLHALLADDDGNTVPNSDYVDPEAFLQGRSQTAADPFENDEPDVLLRDPRPSSGRRLVGSLATAAGVVPDGIVSAVSEVLANAHLHGRRPVTLRAWAQAGRVVVTVKDAGPGPSDPFAGLLRPNLEPTSGRGLWIAHHLCGLLTIATDSDGCLVRIVSDADADADARQ
jgi:hypothetical protein